jgi:hypothetical protein
MPWQFAVLRQRASHNGRGGRLGLSRTSITTPLRRGLSRRVRSPGAAPQAAASAGGLAGEGPLDGAAPSDGGLKHGSLEDVAL